MHLFNQTCFFCLVSGIGLCSDEMSDRATPQLVEQWEER